MLAKGVQGYVVVELTVDEDGFVRDAVVADSGPLGDGPQEAASYKAFHGPALRSVGQYRYAPKFQDGKPTTTSNVRTKVTFQFQRR
jgi:protein TonB